MDKYAAYRIEGEPDLDPRARVLFEDHVFQAVRVPASVSDEELAACKSPADLKALVRRGRDRGRKGRSGVAFHDRSKQGGEFISVDSEGGNIGPPIVTYRKVKGREKKERVEKQKQRSVLWMAGGSPNFPDQILTVENKREWAEGLDRETIWEKLLSLPRQFAGPPGSPAPIFIGFGFSYDTGQLVAGMPYTRAWAVKNRVPWAKRNDIDWPETFRFPVLCGDYAISCIPRKVVVLYKLRNPNKPWKVSKKGKRSLDFVERVEIYDVHGFFQSSLLEAIKKFPGVVTPEELEIIKQGKAERGALHIEDMTKTDLAKLKRYTSLELKALSAMMTRLRDGFNYPDPATGETIHLKIRNWWGAGAIAQALLKQHLGENARAILGDMSGPQFALDAETGELTDADALQWAFHARFGGRIELCKQGVSLLPFYVYDISSAYPAIAVELPSMEGGKWVRKKNPTRAEIEGANILSMFKVKTRYFNTRLPIYPLPFRSEAGSIMFPPEIVAGRYMRDDVIAAFKWFDYWNSRGELCDYSISRNGPPEIIVEEALFFIPGDPTSRPLAFIKTLFDWRADLVQKDKNDMRGQVIKLGINSVYGKFGQRVGKKGEPPNYGCLWYAAAITAGTRRKIMEGALTNPRAVACFATDALFADKPLPLHIPPKKTLGEWEAKTYPGAALIQSGVYALREEPGADGKPKLKIASRGFNPERGGGEDDGMSAADAFADAFEHEAFVDVPKLWLEDGDALRSIDTSYIGLGAATASRQSWKDCGYWKTSERELRLNQMSAKRSVPTAKKMRQARALRLVPLGVIPYAFNLKLGLSGELRESAPAIPNWASAHYADYGPDLPEWAKGEKPKRRRGADDIDEDADGKNVHDGLADDRDPVF